MEKQQKTKFLKGALIIGIVIVLNLFFNYALSLVYKAPSYDAFCPTSQVETPATTQTDCVAQGGQWTAENYAPATAPVGPDGKAVTGYCTPNYTCQNNFNNAEDAYSRNVFIILVVLGALSLLAGILLPGNVTIGTALSYGGVLSFIIASIRYWSSADNGIKVLILAIALILLIGTGIKKFKD